MPSWRKPIFKLSVNARHDGGQPPHDLFGLESEDAIAQATKALIAASVSVLAADMVEAIHFKDEAAAGSEAVAREPASKR